MRLKLSRSEICLWRRHGREASPGQELAPDVLLMDISMPELNGLTATAKLKRVAPAIKILTLTRHTDEAYLQELLQAGVSGYVLKQSAASELLRAIRAVASGGNYLDPSMTGKVFGNYVGKSAKKPRGETRAHNERRESHHCAIRLRLQQNEIPINDPSSKPSISQSQRPQKTRYAQPHRHCTLRHSARLDARKLITDS